MEGVQVALNITIIRSAIRARHQDLHMSAEEPYDLFFYPEIGRNMFL
jgi:hypothetical protein